MGKVFGWLPGIVRLAIGMVVVGAMIGYVLSAVVSTVINDQGWFATSGESPQARSYMVALLQREADTLTALRPQQDVVSQALARQAAQQSRQQAKPLSLTYLGGASQGRVSVQIYAVEVRANDGSQQLFSLALTLVGGQVVLTR
ncbi:MAG TPA: hypothetical protein VFC31_07435 [Candidatus Limnocylindria bacterium]|nr:hypothetical protein [Candidatus Limnocylindria bacterium]